MQGRPLVFSQKRVGRNSKQFNIYKFRSMSTGSLPEESSFNPKRIDRRTPLGKILRQYKLDELPQLWNVLKGDMSIVGPRPEVPQWVDEALADWQSVLSVKPGITDLASLSYVNEEELLNSAENPEAFYASEVLPDKLRLSKQYVQDISLRGDISIMVKTIRKMV